MLAVLDLSVEGRARARKVTEFEANDLSRHRLGTLAEGVSLSGIINMAAPEVKSRQRRSYSLSGRY